MSQINLLFLHKLVAFRKHLSYAIQTSHLYYVINLHPLLPFSFHPPQTNTFQCILATNNIQSIAILQYADGLMQWTSASATRYARVGFNAGDGVKYTAIPGSGTSAIINITSTSNVQVPGQWMYQIQSTKITSLGTN